MRAAVRRGARRLGPACMGPVGASWPAATAGVKKRGGSSRTRRARTPRNVAGMGVACITASEIDWRGGTPCHVLRPCFCDPSYWAHQP